MSSTSKITTLGPSVLMPVEKLRENPHNARTHSPEQVGKLAGLIREFGFIGVIVVDASMTVIAGHGRLMAARLLKMKQVPVVVVEHLTEAQKRALVISDNKIGLESSWDQDKLAREIAALAEEHIELGLTAFNPQEIANLLDSIDTSVEGFDGDVDSGPAPVDAPKTQKVGYSVVILCASLFEQENILAECESRGWNAKIGK